MGRFDQQWCDELVAEMPPPSASPLRVLYVVTDTDEGKVAFSITSDSAGTTATAGKLPRGEKADITITAKESVLVDIWSENRTRDEAYMAGDIKVEGAYDIWLDELVGLFEDSPWASAWQRSVG